LRIGGTVDVERELFLESPANEVWDALTDPDQLETWFATEVDFDPTPGGRASFRWANGEARDAVVEQIEPERRLVLRWLDDDGIVWLELEGTERGTRLLVVETSPEFRTALDIRALAACTVA
jgi:uncharacterized protein YndB with AHSA1/START domain